MVPDRCVRHTNVLPSLQLASRRHHVSSLPVVGVNGARGAPVIGQHVVLVLFIGNVHARIQSTVFRLLHIAIKTIGLKKHFRMVHS